MLAESDVQGILPFYAVLFVLAIPLPRLLVLALADLPHRLAAVGAKVLGIEHDQIGRWEHFWTEAGRR